MRPGATRPGLRRRPSCSRAPASINVQAADSPRIFSDPGSLSYGYIRPASRAASSTLLLAIQDAGGGAGSWSVTVQPQSASDGTTIDAPPVVTVPPGGTTTLGSHGACHPGCADR